MSLSWEKSEGPAGGGQTESLRQAFASRSEKVLAGDRCPEPDRIWAALRGDLPAPERRGVVLHTARCPACAEDFRLAAQLAEAAGERMPRARDESATTWTWWTRGFAAAAAVVLVAVGLGRLGDTPPPVHRTGEEELIRSLLVPGQTLPRDDFLLRWSGPEGARYDVEVTTYPELELVARARSLEATELLVAQEDLAGVPPGARLLWQVEAVLPDGSTSPSSSFDVRVGP